MPFVSRCSVGGSSAPLPTGNAGHRLTAVQSGCSFFLIYLAPLLVALADAEAALIWTPPRIRSFLTNGVKSASDILPSPFCLPCAPIGLHGASLSAGQIVSLTLARARTHTLAHADCARTRTRKGIVHFSKILSVLTLGQFKCLLDNTRCHAHPKVTVERLLNSDPLSLVREEVRIFSSSFN